MATQTRPNGFGIIDDSGSNQAAYDRDLPEATNGFADEQVLPAKKYNHTLMRHGQWIRRFDQQMTPHPYFFSPTASSRLTLDAFYYDTGPGLVASLQESSAYVVKGFVVDLSDVEAANQGFDTHTFTASKDTHVYAKTDGTLRFSVVNIGVPASENADDLHIGTMTTDATDRTVWTEATGDAATRRVQVTALQWEYAAPLIARRAVRWLAPSGNRRVHERQNASADAKGTCFSDTITYQGVGPGLVNLNVIPASLLTLTDGMISITCQSTIVEVGDANNGTVLWHRNAFVMLSGTLSVLAPPSPAPERDYNLGGIVFSDGTLNALANAIVLSLGIEALKTANVEITFTVSVISA